MKRVVDTLGSTATYAWACDTAPCDTGDFYPDSVTFGPYSVKLYRETRPDVTSAAQRNYRSDPNPAKPWKRSLVLAAIVTRTALASTGEAPESRQLPLEAKQRVTANYGKLPLHFEANQGQTHDQVKFLARGSGYGLFLTSTESVLVLRKTKPARPAEGVVRGEVAAPRQPSPPEVLRMRLLGAKPRPALVGREQLHSKS